MKKQWLFIYFSLLLPSITLVAQDDNQVAIAALRNDVVRLAEAYRQAVVRIQELEELVVQQRKSSSNSNQQTIRDLELKVERLEALINEQNLALRKEIVNESNTRKKVIESLAKEVNKDLNAIGSRNGGTRSTPTTSTAIPAGYKLIEIEILKGDTLSEIAHSAGITVEKIKEINNMRNDTIHVGQKIKVLVKK